MAELKIPTETIELPSKGLVYPKDNPLSEGKIEMRYMTAKHEDILTNSNYMKQGVVFDKLLQSLIVTKINYNDLILGDKDAILVAARILGYGKDYRITYKNQNTGEDEDYTIDLSEIREKELDEDLFTGKNEFTYTLPTSGDEITFRLTTHGDEKKIEDDINANKKINISSNITSKLKQNIVAVNGNSETKTIRTFVDEYMLSADSRALREYMKKITPGLNMTFTFVGSDGYTEEGVEIPIGFSFFYPSF
jgi:general stress protein 26